MSVISSFEDAFDKHRELIGEIVEESARECWIPGAVIEREVVSKVVRRAMIDGNDMMHTRKFSDLDGLLLSRLHAWVTKKTIQRIERLEYEHRLNAQDCCFNCTSWLEGGVREVKPGFTEPFASVCRRFPHYENRIDSDWCGEHERRPSSLSLPAKTATGISQLQHGGPGMTMKEIVESGL